MNDSVQMGEMTWQEYQAKIRDGGILYVPVGALEQHGRHMPLNVDALLPAAVSDAVARETNGIVAPVLPYGCKSQQRCGGGNFFPGTTSLDGGTMTAVIRDILREFVRHGARKFVMMNGHFENQAFIIEAVDLALRDAAALGLRDIRVLFISYWDFINDPEVLDYLYPDGLAGWDVEHAGLMETSLILHLQPHLVQLERAVSHPPAVFPLYDVYPPHEDWTPAPGTLSSPEKATAEKGRLILDTCSKAIIEVVKQEFADRPR